MWLKKQRQRLLIASVVPNVNRSSLQTVFDDNARMQTPETVSFPTPKAELLSMCIRSGIYSVILLNYTTTHSVNEDLSQVLAKNGRTRQL